MHGVGWRPLFGDFEFADFLFAGIAGAVGCCGVGRGLEVGAMLVGFVVALAEGGDQLIRVDLSYLFSVDFFKKVHEERRVKEMGKETR